MNLQISFMSVSLLLVMAIACAQTNDSKKTGFIVDKSVKVKIENQLKQFEGGANACIVYEIIENDKLIDTSSSLGTPGLSFTTFMENSDAIECVNGVDDGFGFSLILNKDTTLLKFIVRNKPDENSINASILPDINVECISKKITLASSPTYKTGEIVEGIVELESVYFEMIFPEGKKRRLKFKIRTYFRSEPLPIVEGKYKTLQRNN